MGAGAAGGGAGGVAAQTAELDAEIRRLTEAGLSTAAIARALGRTRMTVYRRRGAVSEQTAELEARRLRIAALAREGCSVDEICDRMPEASRRSVMGAFYAIKRHGGDPDEHEPPDWRRPCERHLLDLKREHKFGCGELDIRPGPASHVPHRPPAISYGGSPAADCEAFNTDET